MDRLDRSSADIELPGRRRPRCGGCAHDKRECESVCSL